MATFGPGGPLVRVGAPSANVRVEGARQLAQILKMLPERAQRRVLNNALRAGGRIIAKRAKELAPQDTGNTIRVIDIRSLRQPRRADAIVFVGLRRERFPDPRRKTGHDQPSRRAHLLEFGTSKMRARPFLRPALDEKGIEAIRKMSQIMARGIEREARRLAGELPTRRRLTRAA